MIHRFHRATDQYISTLAALDSASRSNKAQVALINHAVKEALDANHIRQMARAANGSSALEQLLKHAADMKNEGTQSILRFAGNGTPVTNAAPSVETLALRGRDLLDAAEQISLALSSPAAIPASTANPPIGPNPGRFQDDRAKIIGGTFGTGSQATGTTKTTDAPAQPAGNTSSKRWITHPQDACPADRFHGRTQAPLNRTDHSIVKAKWKPGSTRLPLLELTVVDENSRI